MQVFEYTGGIQSLDQCNEATGLLKVARHAPCCHGWQLSSAPESPYGHMPRVTVPGEASCQCTGLVPPRDAQVVITANNIGSLQQLTDTWARCGRCSHSVLEHGECLLDPQQERSRRMKVAIRLDEILQDFNYQDADLVSLKKQIHSLAYQRKELQFPQSLQNQDHESSPASSILSQPASQSKSAHLPPTHTSISTTNASSTNDPRGNSRQNTSKKNSKRSLHSQSNSPNLPRNIPNVDIFQTLNYVYQRAYHFEMEPRIYAPIVLSCKTSCNSPVRIQITYNRSPEIKRSICKRCMHIRVEGLTCHTSIRGTLSSNTETKRNQFVSSKCTYCNHVRVRMISRIPYSIKTSQSKHRNLSQRQRRRRYMWRKYNTPNTDIKANLATIPYEDRLKGTSWESPFKRFVEARDGDMDYLNKALEMRGGHVITVGTSHRGQVGKVLDTTAQDKVNV